MYNSIRREFFYPHPPEKVWEFLTRADLLAQWIMPNDFQPIKGHEFQFKTKPLPQFDSDGVIYCRVLEIEPFQKLSYSWKTGPGTGHHSLDSVVVWTLVEQDHGTTLQLVHSGFKEKENMNIFLAMTEGWMKIVEKLGTLLNTQPHAAATT